MSRKLVLSLLLLMLGFASLDAMNEPPVNDTGARATHGGSPWPPE